MIELASIATRVATDSDEPFLRGLFHVVRGPEFAPANLSVAQLSALLDQQYDAMRSYYAQEFPETVYTILEVAGEPIGYEAVQTTHELHLIDIALSPNYRNQRIGTSRIERLQSLAISSGTSVMLAVEIFNPAKALYERLGFTVEMEMGIYQQMRWTPPSS